MRHKKLFMLPAIAALAASPAARADDKDMPGPINSLSDVQDTAKMLFKVADANNDGVISQKEALDAGNLMVGGFFFRADANGDGKVTKEEADQARENMFAQRPLLRFVFQRAEQEAKANPGTPTAEQTKQNILNIVDSNRDGAIDAMELRQVVQTGVQSVFLTADRNGDGNLDPSELNAAVVDVGRAGLQAAFQTADLDKNGQVSREEFDKAILTPANVAFRVMDANNDGQLSPEELRSGAQIVVRELRNLDVPEPANSLPNQAKRAVQNAPRPAINVAPTPATTAPAPAQSSTVIPQ